jgi:hypothetical protein
MDDVRAAKACSMAMNSSDNFISCTGIVEKYYTSIYVCFVVAIWGGVKKWDVVAFVSRFKVSIRMTFSNLQLMKQSLYIFSTTLTREFGVPYLLRYAYSGGICLCYM